MISKVDTDVPALEGLSLDLRENGLAPGQVVVRIDPRYFRPTEVETLLGDASKAEENLEWKPEITFSEMVGEMVRFDLQEALKDEFCRQEGFRVNRYYE